MTREQIIQFGDLITGVQAAVPKARTNTMTTSEQFASLVRQLYPGDADFDFDKVGVLWSAQTEKIRQAWFKSRNDKEKVETMPIFGKEIDRNYATICSPSRYKEDRPSKQIR